ncbi:HAD family hydrolase [Chamaesiphon polymorphus]|uniref:Haloacid dehalogenase n=1 Tax=Chamaesiphon polymorphus CCALA 037 TaxID=2107692 RepID=A0A2T1GLW1_9CYAN|nr:HAD family hydrolase [Chamaesiphon polymorphus]PSB58867.1 haloacid dehalogenase [Chamaesiphon polymorphus CCALA 037]
MNAARILALDFDGVLCDGMAEYWQTAWRTYTQVWQLDRLEPSPGVAEKFRELRPLIEVGWEMPVLIRALTLGISTDRMLSSWQRIRDRILADSRLSGVKVSQQLDTVRDNWIQQDPASWLGLHQFYPGVIEMLQELPNRKIQPIIITTKESRFVTQLLQDNGVELSSEFIWGKELKRSKTDSLKQLLDRGSKKAPAIWFVEDRLNTLAKVATQPELESVKLYLADWGYNTAAEREAALQQSRIQILSLADLPTLGGNPKKATVAGSKGDLSAVEM